MSSTTGVTIYRRIKKRRTAIKEGAAGDVFDYGKRNTNFQTSAPHKAICVPIISPQHPITHETQHR